MGKALGTLVLIIILAVLAFLVIAALNPDLANDIVNFFTQRP